MKSLDSSHILAKIVEAKRARLLKQRRMVPDAIMRDMAKKAKPVPSFRSALEGPMATRIIAEIKKASPSKGVLTSDLNVEDLAKTYTECGAAAISVVTEQDFFQGDLSWIQKIRQVSPLPVLRKDFIFDAFQVYETRAAGASAVLLIAAMLQPEELKSFVSLAAETGLDALVEVHDEAELAEAMQAGASIVGVNNRDLKTFNVSLETSIRLAARIPDNVLFVAESGIHGRADLNRLLECGADAFLVGEHLLTSGDPARSLGALL